MKNFKLNWGWSILLVYITFMLVFLFYFWRSFKELETNELVTEDYYQKELTYGDVLDKTKNADTMRIPVEIIEAKDGINIIFPEYMTDVKGKITLYKPDNSKLDRTFDINIDDNKTQKINKSDYIPGRWDIILDWESDKTPYFIKKKMTLK